MPTVRRTIIILLALCMHLSMQAQMESHPTYRRYITQDGLPQIQAERLWQDSRGYIYIGTLSGFVRFDGHGFTPFLKGRRLNIVGFAEVTDDEPAHMEGGEVRALGFIKQWKVDFDHVTPLSLDPKGHWLLNNLNAGNLPNGYVLVEDSLEQHRRLCLLTKHGLRTLLAHQLLEEMTPDRKLYYDPASGEAIIPTEKGVFRIRKGTGKAVRISDKADVFTLLRTNDGLLAFASDGIYEVGNGRLSQKVQADWKAASYGLTVRQLRSGALVVADEHTVYLCQKGAASSSNTHIRQIHTGINLIRDVLVDRWDRLWVASYQGVYCFFNQGFTNHWLTDSSDIVRAVGVADKGRLVVGTLNGKLMTYRYAQNAVSGIRLISEDAEQFYAPCATKVGSRVYMPGNGDVVSLNSDSLDASPVWLHLPRDRYQFVSEAWGKLITANRTGIFAYNPTIGVIDTLTTDILHPWCAAQGGDGRLWVGSSTGLFCIDKEHRVEKIPYRAQKLIISALVADQRGSIFFASADSLFFVSPGNKAVDGTKGNLIESMQSQIPELCGHEIRSLHVSPRGFLVVAVIDGLFVCRISNDYELSDIRFFDQQNGFTMTEPLKAVMAETEDGTIWVPGVEQMTSFRPEELLAYNEEETYIAPPLRWWQHVWVWLTAMALLAMGVWAVTRWYEKRRNRRHMIRLEREKKQREEQIEAIRQKAIQAEANDLAKDIVKMTEKDYEEKLTLRTATSTIVVEVKDIAFFKGDGNYSQIVTFRGKSTVLMGLGALERMLSPNVFVRADRSTLVNIHHICALQPKQRRCIFRSPSGQEVETTLLAPAFKRLQNLL